MKKKSILWLSVLFLCIIAAAGIVILRNRQDAVTVSEEYHERDAACDADFRMWRGMGIHV